ncbi:hypothetical protein TPHA_0K01320 [Tetrapisispora phaffii CBS 4417]|uniref:Uncharacterized protein n=1 Tax=Tetrapisispora phaffii (strain ATCC 24235 / CBS 4417 / NBRC 1672 / NRRL Y-8282 / UCD 70-5) TaxID=1071381 RepID=G8BZD7_TETPH|nr:hypothetical protein TPHA_0K01320 [Tetrapisispora phaffii CBS 4417]CCE65265.1 hypothetical protein TPHA_0K01320 [Tetrapisispora phaffii CBS 4417]
MLDPLAKQKLLWTIGHSITVVLGIIFSITYFYHVIHFYKYRQWKWLFLRLNKSYAYIQGNSWTAYFAGMLPNIIYRLSLIGYLTASVVSLNQQYSNSNPTWYDLLSSESFQAVLLAVVWLIGGRKSFYRLCPFMIISYLHLLNRNNEFKGDEKATEKFIMKNCKLLRTIGYIESATVVALVFDTILLKDGTSGFSLVFYIGLFWLRLNFNSYARINALNILEKIKPYLSDNAKKFVDKAESYIFLKIKQDRLRCQNR